LASYRPMVELLEDRLPPGDVLLGQVMSSAWLGQDVAALRTGGRSGLTQPEPQFPEYRVGMRPLVVSAASELPAAPLLAAAFVPGQGEVFQAIAEPANQQVHIKRRAYAELAGLDKDQLDQLIEDDFDTLA